MNQSNRYHFRPPSQRLLYVAIVFTIITIITFVVIVVAGSNTSYYLIPTILTIGSLIITFISFGWKDIIPLYHKLFYHIRKIRLIAFFSVLVKTIAFISTVLTTLTVLGFVSIILGFLNKVLPLIIVGIMVSILSLLLFIIFYALLEDKAKVRQISTDTIPYPSPSDDEEVEILLKEILYEYGPDGKSLWQRKRLHMRVLKNGINCFIDRYRWTGSGECFVRSITPGFNITNQHKEDIWDYFTVSFPHPLQKGEEVDFTIEWEFFDLNKSAIPFLSTMIDRKTNHLLLQVVLPNELAPKRAFTYEFENFIDTLPIETNQISWSPATKRLTYDVPHPKKYHKYTIRWYSE